MNRQLTIKDKKAIASQLKEAKTLLDLVEILNSVQKLLVKDDDKIYPITENKLKYFIYGKKTTSYMSFEIPKKSGGSRVITAPVKELKHIQRLLNQCLHSIYYPKPQAHGFIPGRNIVTNAIPHCGKKYVYNIDLKDFFPSISVGRVWGVLTKVAQTNLDGKMGWMIANLCTNEGVLPQGAPTSPTLSNLICIRLDQKLYHLSQENKFVYTRYADDITISSDENIFNQEFKSQLASIIAEEGFSLNSKKERLQKNNVTEDNVLFRQHQEVTGIVVNERPNVNKKYIKNLRATLHNWEEYGYQIASLLHEHFYRFAKGFQRNNENVPPLENVVMGRLEYFGMVRGKDDSKYQYYKSIFDSLCMKDDYTPSEFEDVLSTWQNKGINAAMNLFYDKRNISRENG